MRRPGGFFTEHIVDILENVHGGENLIAIEKDIREKGILSDYYVETKTIYNAHREQGVSEQVLRKEWQGRIG